MLLLDMVLITAVGTLRQWTNLIQVVIGKKINETEKPRDVWPCLELVAPVGGPKTFFLYLSIHLTFSVFVRFSHFE